jgi:hypothetical protein
MPRVAQEPTAVSEPQPRSLARFGSLGSIAPWAGTCTRAKGCIVEVDTECVPAPCWTLPLKAAPSRERCSGPR